MYILVDTSSEIVLVMDKEIAKKGNTYITDTYGSFYPADTMDVRKVIAFPGDFSPGVYCYDLENNSFYPNEANVASI